LTAWLPGELKAWKDHIYCIWDHLCRWVLNHKTLKRLVLTNFHLTDIHAKQLLSSLDKTNAPIVEVDLDGCKFDSPDLKKLIQDRYTT